MIKPFVAIMAVAVVLSVIGCIGGGHKDCGAMKECMSDALMNCDKAYFYKGSYNYDAEYWIEGLAEEGYCKVHKKIVDVNTDFNSLIENLKGKNMPLGKIVIEYLSTTEDIFVLVTPL